MKTKTIFEWLDWYEQHGGSRELNLREDETVLYHPEHGIVSFVYDDKEVKVLDVHHMIGDGKYWFGVLKEIMKMHGLTKMIGYTERNPAVWGRKYGLRIKGYYMECDIDELDKII